MDQLATLPNTQYNLMNCMISLKKARFLLKGNTRWKSTAGPAWEMLSVAHGILARWWPCLVKRSLRASDLQWGWRLRSRPAPHPVEIWFKTSNWPILYPKFNMFTGLFVKSQVQEVGTKCRIKISQTWHWLTSKIIGIDNICCFSIWTSKSFGNTLAI